jgi:hypothetical protein
MDLRIDLSRVEREIQRCSDAETGRAMRALLDVIRRNTTRIDALEAWKASHETRSGQPPSPNA